MSDRVNNPLFARFYRAMESRCGKVQHEDRRRLLDGVKGRVVEVGAGHGPNFPFYPPEVSEVVAVEPEPYMRSQAELAAKKAPVPVTVVAGTAASIPLPNASADAGVTSLVLCSVDSQDAALAELHRVIRPGGELRFYEHVRGSGLVGLMQRASDATVWPRMFGGCHTNRDTTAAIERAGFVIETRKDMSVKVLGMPNPVTPHVIGTARRP